MKAFILIFAFFLTSSAYSQRDNQSCLQQSVMLDAGNIKTQIWNTGIFNRDIISSNAPGFEWPKSSGKFSIFTTGITTIARVNNEIRMAAASYEGEYCPGYALNGQFFTGPEFKLYKISRGDNHLNNPDWANWGLMVPYGAPYVDVNNNGIYEAAIDTPGVKYAAQTVFICMSDADPSSHSSSEGFGGGTAPLGADMHLTFWAYDNTSVLYPNIKDMQFFKAEIINKGLFNWNSIYCAIISDPDLGDASDDRVGCDTVLELSYCYNGDNNDGGSFGYGINPPAAGIKFLNKNMTSFNHWGLHHYPLCEQNPDDGDESYNFLKGFKKDGTKWLTVPERNITKFCFPGNPESTLGWTELKGKIENCENDSTGAIVAFGSGDRRIVMSSGSDSQTVPLGSSITLFGVQLIARGNNYLNSVTKLKQISSEAQLLYNNNFIVNIEPVSEIIPQDYKLHQNYPNPFNPFTNIKFEIPKAGNTSLIIYDASGKQAALLINQTLDAGQYKITWNAAEVSSGAYFYRLVSNNFVETKRMVLVK